MVAWLFLGAAFIMDSKLPLYFFAKEKAVSLLKGTWGETESAERGRDSVLWLCHAGFFPMFYSVWPLPCQNMTVKLLSLNVNVLLFSKFILGFESASNFLLSYKMDELVNAWPGEGGAEAPTQHALAMSSKMEGKWGGMPCLFLSCFSLASWPGTCPLAHESTEFPNPENTVAGTIVLTASDAQ